MSQTPAAPAATSSPPPGASSRGPSRVRRFLLILLLLLVLLGAAHAALLWWMGGQMRTALESWAALRRAQGWQVEYGAPRSTGWPFAAALRLPGLRLAAGGLEWRAEALRLSVTPQHPDQLRLEAEGAQQLVLGGAPMPLRAGALQAELTLNGTAPPLAGVLNGTGLRLESPYGALVLEQLQASFDASATEATAFSARLRGLLLPGRQPLGQRVEEITTQGMLHGSLNGPGPLAQRAAAWRDAGGRLEVQGLTLRWGAMAASAAATLALDDALQPSGAGTLRLANPSEVLDALAAARLMPPATAAMARRILPLLTRLDTGGGVPVIELPVLLEERSLSAARIPLLRLRPLEW